MRTAEVDVNRLPRRAQARAAEPARQHVRLVSRLLVAQAGVAAAVSLSFNRRSGPAVLTTLAFVVVLVALATLASTGTHTARTVVLGAESALIVFGLYRFAFDRYLGGTLSAIVVGAVLLHPAVSRAYGAAGLSRAADSAEAVAPPQ